MMENDTGLIHGTPGSSDDAIVRTHQQSLGYVLARAHHQLRQYMTQALAGSGLHMGQVVILASLHAQSLLSAETELSDLTQTRLTQITGIEKSSLVLSLDALEKDGWVERRRHPTDRRAYIVHLTPSGAERFHQVGERLKQYESECLAVFDGVERQQLSEQLLRLTRHIQDIQALERGTSGTSETADTAGTE